MKRYFEILKSRDFDTLTNDIKQILKQPYIRYDIDGLEPIIIDDSANSHIVNIDYDDDKYVQEVNDVIKPLKLKKIRSSPTFIDVTNNKQHSVLTCIRNPVVAKQSLFNANYQCEICPSHLTFVRRKDGTPYTEPHHLIPMFMQGKIKNEDGIAISLDVENNIVSLCSNCHNKLHYGNDIKDDLLCLYLSRISMLEEAGINVTFEELLAMYSMVE